MKKKITALFLLLCLICGVMACGGEEEKKEEKKSKKNKAAMVTVNGEDYDLSKDFKDVVGDMVKDEIKVASLTSYRYFDEKGKEVKGTSGLQDRADVFAREADCSLYFAPKEAEEITEEYGYFIRKDFYFEHMEEKEIESGFGVASLEDVEDKLDTEAFLKIKKSMMAAGEEGYVGVFIDGKAVDFSEYEDELEELKEFTGEGPDAIIGVSFPNARAFGMGRLNGDIFRTCHSYEELKETAERVEMSLEEELLILFALEDGFERLKDEDAERISVLNFGVFEDEEELNMAYSEFYFDKEWN